jgi:hypothetical protein
LFSQNQKIKQPERNPLARNLSVIKTLDSMPLGCRRVRAPPSSIYFPGESRGAGGGQKSGIFKRGPQGSTARLAAISSPDIFFGYGGGQIFAPLHPGRAGGAHAFQQNSENFFRLVHEASPDEATSGGTEKSPRNSGWGGRSVTNLVKEER